MAMDTVNVIEAVTDECDQCADNPHLSKNCSLLGEYSFSVGSIQFNSKSGEIEIRY